MDLPHLQSVSTQLASLKQGPHDREMGETPGSEGSLDGWTDPPREWLNVRGIPNTVEKASWEGGREALEWPSAHVAAGTMGWVFLSALRAETETTL